MLHYFKLFDIFSGGKNSVGFDELFSLVDFSTYMSQLIQRPRWPDGATMNVLLHLFYCRENINIVEARIWCILK